MKLTGGKTTKADRKILETDRFSLHAEVGPHNIIAGFVITDKKKKLKRVVLVLNGNFDKAWKEVGTKIKPYL